MDRYGPRMCLALHALTAFCLVLIEPFCMVIIMCMMVTAVHI